MGLEAAKGLVKRRDLERLFENDQLNLQMVAGLAFRFYSEARITFMPTYKYDVGSDEYDSSEKARIPAWTDRILRKGTNLRQLAYNSAPLRFSDHRPVYAIFECTVNIVNEKLRDKISREIYERRKVEVGGDTANLVGDESEDEDLIGYDAIEPGLPPASSDRQKWWLDNGKMARSSISPPKPDGPGHQTILNPKRPANPYMPSDEPDWVNVPRSESRLSSFSSMSTSPYEHVNHSTLLSSSASSSTPRKLPPPYDPSALPAKVGRLHISDDTKGSQADGPPPPPPPRRQTSMSYMSAADALAPSVAQKRKPIPAPAAGPKPAGPQQIPAQHKSRPPIARKPAHLTAPVSPPSSTSTSFISDTTTPHASQASLLDPPHRSTPSANGFSSSKFDSSLPSLLARNGSVREHTPPPPQLPRRSNTSASTNVVTQGSRMAAAGGIPHVGLAAAAAAASSQERKPQLPMRKPTTAMPMPMPIPVSTTQKQAPPPPPPAPRRTQEVDLLGGDDGAMEMGGWEALRPS